MENKSHIVLILHNILQKIMTDPEEEDLQALAELIEDLSVEFLKISENKILGALLTLIINGEKTKTGIKTVALKAISNMIAKCKLENAEAYLRLYTLTCNQIFDQNSCSLDIHAPEELKEEVMNALQTYTDNLTDEARAKVYNTENSGQLNPVKILSQGVLLAMQIAKSEKSATLRCSALKFILALAQSSKINSSFIEKVGEMFINFLPGLITPLTEIITKDDTCHHAVISLAVRCWGVVLWATLSDFPSENKTMSECDVLKAWINKAHVACADDPSVWLSVLAKPKRTPEWVKAAVQTLQTVIKRVASKFVYPHPMVRREIVQMFGSILTNCASNLGSHAGPLLDALVYLSIYEDERVKGDAVLYLAIVTKETLLLLAQERMPAVLSQLTQNIRSGDQEASVSSLNMLHAYFKLFDPKSDKINGPCVLINPPLLQKLISSLKIAMKIELTLEIVHEHELEPSDYERYGNKWRGISVHAKILDAIQNICRFLAFYNSEMAISITLDNYKKDKNLESLLLLNMIVLHCKLKPYLLENLLNFYLDVNNTTVVCDPTPKKLSFSIATIILSMEGLSSMAADLSEPKNLRKVLYPIVSRMGSRFSAVRSAGVKAAQDISGAGTVKALIESNIDYLTHDIVLRLRKMSEEDVLDAVRIIVHMCPATTLPQLQAIVTQILASSNINYYSPHIGPYLRVFHAFIQCAAAVSPPKSTRNPNPVENKTLGENLADYIRGKEAEVAEMEDCASEDISEHVEEERPKPPLHVHICVKTVARCVHYLPMCTNMQKVVCLEVLETGLRVVSSWEDELLPLVHQVWSTLVKTMDTNAKPLIIGRSFALLVTMCQLSKDFIRMRTLKEVLPFLRDYLKISAKQSYKQSPKTAFYTTQGFKLQCQLLAGLGELTINLSLRERDTSLIVEAAIPYLSKHQPAKLQDCAVALYHSILKYDPYFVTHRLGFLKNEDEFCNNVVRIENKQGIKNSSSSTADSRPRLL